MYPISDGTRLIPATGARGRWISVNKARLVYKQVPGQSGLYRKNLSQKTNKQTKNSSMDEGGTPQIPFLTKELVGADAFSEALFSGDVGTGRLSMPHWIIPHLCAYGPH